jgi:hypothetical protein
MKEREFEWPPKKVFIDGKEYEVSGVDPHGFLIIDRPVKTDAVTAIATIMVELA